MERIAHLEERIVRHDSAAGLRPKIDRAALMSLAHDLPAAWNAPGADARTKQRITHILRLRDALDAAAIFVAQCHRFNPYPDVAVGL